MKWFEKIECDSCGGMFRKGTGHKCWCKDCKEVHPMCNECYVIGKATGAIKDKKINIGELTDEEREKAR